MKYVFVAAIAMMAGINVFNAQKTEGLSDVALVNVEALANGEWKDGQYIDCMSFITSPKPEELGNAIYPIVVACQPCGNLVIAEMATGKSFCTYYNVNL